MLLELRDGSNADQWNLPCFERKREYIPRFGNGPTKTVENGGVLGKKKYYYYTDTVTSPPLINTPPPLRHRCWTPN